MSKIIICIIFLCAIVSVSYSVCPKKKVLATKLNAEQRFQIVSIHNYQRMLIKKGQVKGQPKAKKMNRLKWDNRLAKEAQKIANTCKFKHVKVTDKRWFAVGQNLYKWSSTGSEKSFNVSDALYSWFNEYKFYKYPKYTKKAGHYTQVIWADTKYVGCGYVYYKTRKGIFKYHKILVCNYGPAGNVKEEKPYKIA